MDDAAFARLVSLTCHDLRTPLATIVGFARTLGRTAELDAQSVRWVGLIDAAAHELDELIDVLSIAARIERGEYDPPRVATPITTLVDAGAPEGSVLVDESAAKTALSALLRAAERHGKVTTPTWRADGRELLLGPLTPQAALVVSGADERDVGALIGLRVLRVFGATVALRGDALAVCFAE
jgi:signal transduction histidine kinase